MCLIVDASAGAIVFATPTAEVSKPIWDWLRRDGKIVLGGKLLIELRRIEAFRLLSTELDRRGAAIVIGDSRVTEAETELATRVEVTSNDHHVLALAIVSGARVLFTEDRRLKNDFRNRLLIRPVGRIYDRAKNAHLLTHTKSCPALRVRKRAKNRR